MGKMKIRTLLRPTLAVVFAFVGLLIARGASPLGIFEIFGDFFLVVAIFAFGILGFIAPDLVELAGRAGIAALALQIARNLPKPTSGSFPFRRRNKKLAGLVNPLVVDTSALIDGRLSEVARAGFLWGSLLVAPSVIAELHRLADSHDDLTRAKGRRGLDELASLGRQKSLKSVVLNSEPKEKTVDEKLVKLAKNTGGKLLTCDFNLAKVAKLKKVTVANLNELANALKTAVLPGERLRIRIIAYGKADDQGVGYLNDGTMVVVEGAREMKGQTVAVRVEKVLQSQAGKMIFASLP